MLCLDELSTQTHCFRLTRPQYEPENAHSLNSESFDPPPTTPLPTPLLPDSHAHANPPLFVVLTECPALCIWRRHWRLRPRFLSGRRRLRTNVLGPGHSRLTHTTAWPRNECNGHCDLRGACCGSLRILLHPTRSLPCPSVRSLWPLPFGKCSKHCKE